MNFPLGNVISIWPTVSLGAWYSHSVLEAPSAGYLTTISGTRVTIGTSTGVDETVVVTELYAPILVHPVSHLFIGAGPNLLTDLSHTVGATSNNRSFMGLTTTIGGWF